MEISTTDYRSLLQAALPQTADTDTQNIHANTLFTASRHRGALEPDVTVVKGGRGVGKTVWFQTLLDDDLRTLAADEYQLPRLLRIEPLPGFGSARDLKQYPSRRVLEQLLAEGAQPVDIWTAVALQGLGVSAVRELPNWSTKLAWLRSNPEQAEDELDRADRSAAERGTVKLFLFDALERLHEDRRHADRLTGSILQFALNLRIETRSLRAKVFIRDDMLESSRAYFPDSSKLTSNAVDLAWSQVDLYGLLFQHLGNADFRTSARFRESTGAWQTKGQRHVPPSRLAADEKTQQDVFIRIAGKFMGPNPRRGRTYTWLPNHLADGRGQTSPRSFLAALRTAVDNTVGTYANHTEPLHWDAIKQGVQKASGTRVKEIEEDLPWVASTIHPLHGLQVPIEQEQILQSWSEQGLSDLLERQAETSRDDDAEVRTGPQYPRDYKRLMDELIALGIMTRRMNGKLDLPDVYRIAFGIGRRGGVPRVKS